MFSFSRVSLILSRSRDTAARAAELGHPAATTMSVTGHMNETQMYKDYSRTGSYLGLGTRRDGLVRVATTNLIELCLGLGTRRDGLVRVATTNLIDV